MTVLRYQHVLKTLFVAGGFLALEPLEAVRDRTVPQEQEEDKNIGEKRHSSLAVKASDQEEGGEMRAAAGLSSQFYYRAVLLRRTMEVSDRIAEDFLHSAPTLLRKSTGCFAFLANFWENYQIKKILIRGIYKAIDSVEADDKILDSLAAFSISYLQKKKSLSSEQIDGASSILEIILKRLVKLPQK